MVETFVSSCHECLEQANRMPNQAGFFQPSATPSRQPWAEISMDWVTKLPDSVHRGAPVDQCLVLTDNLSGLTRLLPAHSTDTAEVTAERYFLEVFSTMGLPRSIRADNDKLLVGAFWKRLMALMGVDMHYTSPASSRSNGGCERKNQEFNRQVRLAVARAGKDWVASLPLYEFAMNRRSTAHRAGHSPFMIDRGHEPRGLTDLMRPGSLERKPLDSAAALSFFHRRVHVAQEAVDSMIITQDEVARSQNRLYRGDVYREGDWVRIHKSHFSSPAARELESFKVKPNWVGPFRVLQVGETGNQVRVDLAGVQTRADNRFNISAIKPSLPPEGHDARLVHERDRSQDGAYAIQSVGSYTLVGGRPSWMVRFAGYGSQHDKRLHLNQMVHPPRLGLDSVPEALLRFEQQRQHTNTPSLPFAYEYPERPPELELGAPMVMSDGYTVIFSPGGRADVASWRAIAAAFDLGVPALKKLNKGNPFIKKHQKQLIDSVIPRHTAVRVCAPRVVAAVLDGTPVVYQW
jgi:hypothetical protein